MTHSAKPSSNQDFSVQLLGISNAIVDVLAHIDAAVLEKIDAVPGSMTLIDEDQAREIYAQMGTTTEMSGGSVANTVAGFANLGGTAAYIGKVRDDKFGDIFNHDMQSLGVDIRLQQATDGAPTARSHVLITADGQRTMQTYLGTCLELALADITAVTVGRPKLILLEGYVWDIAEGPALARKAAEIARENGSAVALSLSDSFCVERHRESFDDFVRNDADIIVANEDEVNALLGTTSMDATLAAQLSELAGQLWNCYGPTEATVWSMMVQVEQPLAGHSVRLSQSLDGYRHWVLDESGNEVGPGGEGELCIEGVSLAQGYWQRSDLSEQAFISWQGRRLYRTGDRVRRIADDEFQYLGRRDDQIKLRGFRIELGEIEANLRRIDGVQDAAVRLLGEGDEACLVGYVETRGEGAPGRVQIRRALHLILPHYMIPSRIVLLESLPKTPSGKIDRKRLPEPA